MCCFYFSNQIKSFGIIGNLNRIVIAVWIRLLIFRDHDGFFFRGRNIYLFFFGWAIDEVVIKIHLTLSIKPSLEVEISPFSHQCLFACSFHNFSCRSWFFSNFQKTFGISDSCCHRSCFSSHFCRQQRTISRPRPWPQSLFISCLKSSSHHILIYMYSSALWYNKNLQFPKNVVGKTNYAAKITFDS